MDGIEEEIQLLEESEEDTLNLQVWDEDLSDVQKNAFEVEKDKFAKYKTLRECANERRKSKLCEYWAKKARVGSLAITNVGQRLKLSQKSGLPVVSAASGQHQGYITGRLNYATTSTDFSHPQISSIRSIRPVLDSASQSVAQPMSVLHRNAAQQNPVQKPQIRPTSVPMPVQQFQNLLFDAQSGLLLMPTSQSGLNPQVTLRGSVVRQPTAPIRTQPALPTSVVASRLPATANNFQAQILANPGVKRIFAGNASLTKPTSVLQTKVTPSPVSALPPKTGFMLQNQNLSSLLQSRNTAAIPKSIPILNRVLEDKVADKNIPGRLNANATNGLESNTDGKMPKGVSVSITKINSNNVAAEKSGVPNGIEKSSIMNGSSDTNNNTNTKTFPSLVVNVKPCLHDKPPRHEINASRAELDQVVKNALVFAPSRFTEWLMQKGLLRLEHKCFIHKGEDGLPVQFKLGMYSDKDKEPFSGGYVWISDCCPGRQISVYEGSIFDSSHHQPTTLLKLIYHWACQTSASNVLTWCKVSGCYLKNFYTLLRSVCVGALHELCPKMGGSGKYIEIGIITLGTTLTAPSGKKQVKIEILGVFDPENKMIRMKLINPTQSSCSLAEASKTRGVQILSPLNVWVDKSSTILIDSSIEQDLLLEMGFKHLVQCQSHTEDEYDSNAPTNVNVMNYLKHVVPKMFQNTLCVLSKSLIQQFLDELSWREKWGKTPSCAFDKILEHIKTMTNWDFGPNNNLVSWLNKTSMNPFQDWSYSRSIAAPSGIDLLPESIRRGDSMPSLSAQVEDTDQTEPASNTSKPPILLPQVSTVNVTNGPLKRKAEPPANDRFNNLEYFKKTAKTIVLESYYYAELPGIKEDISGEFPQNVKCPLCSKPFYSNVEVYKHIYSHVHSIGRASATLNFCNYCLKDIPTASMPSHIQEHHKMITEMGYSCRICQERFAQENLFVIHMWENHCEADTPYSCEICDYKSSFHYEVVDHYNQHHKGSDSVLCPLCLKVLSAKSYICLKQITVHIQTHQMRKGKKCPHCILHFFGDQEYRSHIQEGAHYCRPANSRKIVYFSPEDQTGMLMGKPPPLTRAFSQPPTKKMKSVSGDPLKKQVSSSKPQPDNNMYKIREHTVVMLEVNDRKCLECKVSLESSQHYPGYMSCIKCRFSTCCKSAMKSHHLTTHPANGTGRRGASIKVISTQMMDKALLCQCGFESINPNRLARHLAKCDKTTAFPLDWEEQLAKRPKPTPPATDKEPEPTPEETNDEEISEPGC